MEERLVKELISTVKCAICGRRYQAGNISILYHQHELWFLSVFCQGCRTKGLVAALIKEGQVPEVITDLTEEEMARFRETPPVTADDLLDMHEFLTAFQGDFISLFRKFKAKP